MRAEHHRVVRFRPPAKAAALVHATGAQNDFPLGAHLITPRRGYLHHGIYIGGESVIHYSGSTCGLHRGPVEEISLERFTCGRAVWVRSRTRLDFQPSQVVHRARSRLGENDYRVFSNNCEHFCEWCVYGEHRSYQVDALRSLPARALEVVLRFVAKLIVWPTIQMSDAAISACHRRITNPRATTQASGHNA